VRRASLIIIATLASEPLARADRTSLHGTVSGDVAATDNVFATDREQNEVDLFFTIRPGGILGYDAPRMSHDFTLEGEIINYLAHSDAPSLAARGGVRSAYVTSKHTSVITQINGSSGVLTALSARSTPDQTIPFFTPIGQVDTLQGDANEQFSWRSGRSFTFSQTLFARASRTDDNADDLTPGAIPTIVKSAEVGGSLGFEKSFRRGDAVSFNAGVSVLRLERDADPASIQGPSLDRQINPRAGLQWRHDFNRIWSGSVDGGVVYVYPYGTDPDNPMAEQRDGVFPIMGAALAYTEVWGRAQLQARRDITPNLFVAQNTVNDTALLSLALPLRWLDESRMRAPKVVALGSFGINRTQLIDSVTADVDSSFLIGRLDVGVGYSPRPGFTYGVRYEFVYQTGDDDAVMAIPGFFRNTLSFTFAIRYPDRVAGAETQKRRKNGVRADGKDLVPIGVDPISTDIFDEEGAGEEE
jgi:hypothetical protein